jgi:hypothetical protein
MIFRSPDPGVATPEVPLTRFLTERERAASLAS